jgi:hypothetical protein
MEMVIKAAKKTKMAAPGSKLVWLAKAAVFGV